MELALAAIAFDPMTLEDVFALATRSGYAGVELSARAPALNIDAGPTHVRALRHALDERGLRCPCLSTVVGGYSRLDDGAAARQLELLLRYAEMAKELGAPLIRQVDGGPSSAEAADEDWERAALWLQRGADLMHQSGLGLVLETLPRSLCDSVGGALRLTASIDRENVGVLLDAANMLAAGAMPSFADIVRLSPRIRHVHVKDLERIPRDADDHARSPEFRLALIGEGEVDVRSVLRGLASSGYRGFLTIDQGAVTDVELEVRHNAAAVAALLQSLRPARAHQGGAR